ncbi:MAG: S1 RNA-binding domain-containing protein [Anaerolineae bacterium]|nr:S1 RNA-binding domain-containing protein [Anaerolineae bacterium]
MTTDTTVPTTIEDIKPKMELKGIVRKIELFGALVDVGVGRFGLLHISQISENHVKNVADVLNVGDEVQVWVQDVDRKKGRIGLTMLKPPDVTWNEIAEGTVFNGTVVRVEKFGAFVDIGAERPGLVHVSELAKGYVGDPNEVVNVGDDIEVKVIGINRRKKQIDLSVRALEEPAAVAAILADEEEDDVPTAMELALRQAMEDSGMEMPDRGRAKKTKRRNKKATKHRQEREDIFARTLQQHANE